MDFKDRAIVSLFNSMFSNLPTDEKDNGRALRFVIFLGILAILILILTGTETIKIIHRKKQGASEVSYLRLFLNALAFGALGYYCLNNPGEAEWFFSRYVKIDDFAIQVVGWFYTILALVVLFFGIGQKIRADSKSSRNNLTKEDELRNYYPGDSEFFGYLVEAGMSRQLVRNFIEPFSILAIAALLFAFNPLLGFPLVLCAISYWLVLFGDQASGVEDLRIMAEDYFANQQASGGANQIFHSVN